MASQQKHHKKYSSVNVGAQRKPAPIIGAPSLIQHFAYFRPDSDNANINIDKDSNWRFSIDFLLSKIFFILWNDFNTRKIRNSDVYTRDLFYCKNLDLVKNTLYLCRNHLDLPMVGDDIGNLSNEEIASNLRDTEDHERSLRYEIFSLTTPFKDITLTIRAELRHEFWTLTFLGDFSRCPNLQSQEIYFLDLSQSFNEMNKFVEGKFDFKIHSDVDESTNDNDRKIIRNASDNLYKKFNAMILEEIINPALRSFPNSEKLHSDYVGSPFADFRGIAFGTLVEGDIQDKNSWKFSQSKIADHETKLSVPIRSMGKFLPYVQGIELHIVDVYWPIIKRFFLPSNENIDGSRKYSISKPDVTITGFQASRALYISSLGPLDVGSDYSEPKPVRYMLVCSYPNRWQLGRLVERINNLGTLRLAAIWDIVAIQKASDKLRTLPVYINSIDVTSQDALARLQEVEQRLNTINEIVPGGIATRVERSTYYISMFNQILKIIRGQRVEGFQPYEEFIQRRLGGTFEFIRRVGDRYRDLRLSTSAKFQSLRTDELSILIRSIDRILKDTSNISSQIDGQINRMNQKQRKTNFLVQNAEYFLVFPIFYYLGTAMWHSLDHTKFEVPAWVAYLTAVAVVAVGFALYRHFEKRSGHDSQ